MERLSIRSIEAIQKVITGDVLESGKSIAPYQKGWEIERFFRKFASNEAISAGISSRSRWKYCEDCLFAMNGTAEIERVLDAALDPRRFHETEFSAEEAVKFLNGFLSYDGFQIISARGRYRLVDSAGLLANIESSSTALDPASRLFVDEQIEKCQLKLQSSDYDGAITNARSMLESVLLALEKRIDQSPPQYDGNLQKLYKRVRKNLNLDPNEASISEILKPILTGFSSIVDGIAGMRSNLGDAHPPRYRAERHHARLAVHAANTLVDFLLDSYEYQRRSSSPS